MQVRDEALADIFLWGLIFGGFVCVSYTALKIKAHKERKSDFTGKITAGLILAMAFLVGAIAVLLTRHVG